MTAWNAEDRALLAGADALTLTAGSGPHPGVEIGMVLVDGELYVRAYRGARSRWYLAARDHGHGRVVVAGAARDVLLVTDAAMPHPAVDAAYRAKYGPAAALVAGPQAHAATIRIDPAPEE